MSPVETFGSIVVLLVAVSVALVPLYAVWWLLAGRMPQLLGTFVGVCVGIVYLAALVTFGVWVLPQVGL